MKKIISFFVVVAVLTFSGLSFTFAHENDVPKVYSIIQPDIQVDIQLETIE